LALKLPQITVGHKDGAAAGADGDDSDLSAVERDENSPIHGFDLIGQGSIEGALSPMSLDSNDGND